MVLSVSEQTFTQEVLESPIPVLVNFEAPWCGLCRIIHPLLLQFQAQCGDEIKLVGVNADQNFKLSTTYRLKSLPTLLLIENGTVRHRLEGFRGREDLRLALEDIKVSYSSYPKIYKSPKTADLERRSA
ncbi:thiol reductase thioredoxin [Nostoc sp. 'Peltigera membranacea cyanobiont' 213]|uniref:thioredoxin family protein n=1 Tax=unclassified Nostoc TaxID=2593658 RepID=UPI000B9549A1|nr:MULTISPECIES: thioredoxin domain-containing protein [unclassified Nostoc]AVH67665.1 thioredoxin [Nostoc sp. 'Peltigera membranacea cyanobiont' N6]OYD96135.1 thiol reductase thioredoxin [Nostoc sp. 'Peltigera membranacea cyanobiont' 213]OYE06733.1 thiol reductase thioredoxin [Nostoc sp. 'Peltigera membranacea cyanobiont' 232]